MRHFNREKLKNLRKRKRISTTRLAMETGLEQSTIHRIESGEIKYPSYDSIAIISDFFKVNMETFKQGSYFK